MPKNYLKKILPRQEFFQKHKALRSIAHLLDDPNLFHLNRSSVSRAVSISLAVAIIPFFGHMFISAVLAIWMRANLAISITLVWISNPLTFPFILYLEYKIGQLFLNLFGFGEGRQLIDGAWLDTVLHSWKPILLGTSILGFLLAIVGYYSIQGIWRLDVAKKLKRRRDRTNKRNSTL